MLKTEINHKLESRLQEEIPTTADADGTATLMAEREEKLKSLLMRVKEKSGKAGLKLNIKKVKVMTSDPITLQQIEEDKVEAVTDFIF